MRTSLLSILCILFALQSVLASAVSGHNLRMLNAQNQHHVLVICTGNGTKWINSDVYFASGNIVEVEQPADVDESELSLACFSSLALDHNPVVNNLSPLILIAISNRSESISIPQSQFSNRRSFFRPASRAPPIAYLA